MPSIFPGMDPYLEDPAFWPDFHDSFIVYWRDVLNDRLPESYDARVNERARVIDLKPAARRFAEAGRRHPPRRGRAS